MTTWSVLNLFLARISVDKNYVQFSHEELETLSSEATEVCNMGISGSIAINMRKRYKAPVEVTGVGGL
jgi:hypothetical protein